MISPPAGVRIWLAAGATDMRRGFDGLASLVAQQLNHDPFSGQIFAFRGRRGHLIKLLFWDGQGLVLYAKRLERGHFVWPSASEGVRRGVAHTGAVGDADGGYRLAGAGADMAAGK